MQRIIMQGACFIFGVAGLIGFSFSQAQAKECQSYEPQTSLSYESKPVEYVQAKNARELKIMHRPDRDASAEVLGLAGGDVGTSFNAVFEAQHLEDKEYCLVVTSLHAELFSAPKIQIAREFARGSCEYNSVIEHERKHVEVLKNAHSYHMPKYRNHIEDVAEDLPASEPFTLDELNAKKQEMIDYISYRLNEYLEKMMYDVAERQKRIDTDREYQRIQAQCGNWDSELGRR